MSYAPLDETLNNGAAFRELHDDDALSTDEKPSLRRPQLFQGGTTSDKHLQSLLSEPLTNGEQQQQEQQQHQPDQPNQPQHSSSDPFHMFREDLYRQLERVDESLAEYLRVVHQTDSAVNAHELKDAKKQIKRALKNAEATWNDVHTTVSLVETDRAKFIHIDDKELYERSALVHTSRDRIQRAKVELSSEAVKAKLLADERAKAVRRAGATVLGATNDVERENTALIVNSQARQSLLLQHQDETLDELESAVTRVNVMAETIHDEIGHQNKILTELDEDLTNVEEELGMVMGKLAKFMKTKNTFQLGTIVCLFVTVFVLFFLLVYV